MRVCKRCGCREMTGIGHQAECLSEWVEVPPAPNPTLSSPFLDAFREKLARGMRLTFEETAQLLETHDSLLAAYHETAFLRTTKSNPWRNELGQVSGLVSDIRKYGDLRRPEPMRDDEMPDREWTDLEWTRNQWQLANEHCIALEAALQEMRAVLYAPIAEPTNHTLGWKDDELVQVASCNGDDINFVITIYEWLPCPKCGKELKLLQTNDVLERDKRVGPDDS